MFCENCGNEIESNARFCPSCGAEQGRKINAPDQPQPVPKWDGASESKGNISPKSRLIAALLAFFLGWLGIHRFYVGKVGTGILQILTCWCFIGEIWALIDFIIILCGNFKDNQGLVLSDWDA